MRTVENTPYDRVRRIGQLYVGIGTSNPQTCPSGRQSLHRRASPGSSAGYFCRLANCSSSGRNNWKIGRKATRIIFRLDQLRITVSEIWERDEFLVEIS